MRKIAVLLAGIALLAGCARKEVRISTDEGTLVLQPLLENAMRVRVEPADYKPLPELVYTEKVAAPKYSVSRKNGVVEVRTAAMTARYEEGILTFFDAEGHPLLTEAGRRLEPATVQGEPTYAATQRFQSPDDEFLFGLGQFQDGFLNVRGVTRRLTQVNTQIALPFILSSKGYGLLWNNYGLTDFNPADQAVALSAVDADGRSETVNATGTAGNRRERRFYQTFLGSIDIPEDGTYALLLDMGQKMARRHYLAVDGEPLVDVSNLWLPPTASALMTLRAGTHSLVAEGVRGDEPVLYWRKVDASTTFHSPVAAALDYTVFAGKADEAIGAYRTLTGPVPKMPDWMFGYIHCRERYHSQAEILANAREFKERGLPLDVIVQDWQWWGPTGWNSMEFDRENYPDPKTLTDSLHAMDTRFMISVWSKVDKASNLGKRLEERGAYIDGTDWIDFFNPDVAAFYARNFVDSLARPYGIDAWWFDATEPENDDLAGQRIGKDNVPGEWYRNVYPLMVNRTMYEALTAEGLPSVILTRSAFPGAQRYGVVTWSGDVGNDFGTLRRQIAGGLGQMASGLPWWTFDAGGFFRPGDQYTSPEYQERLVRWVQASTFAPFMRVHGYMSETEPWHYFPETYGIIASYMDLRKRLQPYILRCADRVSREGYTLMRPLVFDFPDDPEALRQDDEYMFGPACLVHPVTEPGVTTWRTYLPACDAGWRDYWTGEVYKGGQYVETPVDLATIPVFIKGGEEF
jgi:alpha-D-xyloside xylohydrolase